MPFIPNTPESLSTVLAATSLPPSTCCGITNTGRPCTRTLKPTPSGAPTTGIIAVVASQRVFFCETHKDQASNVVLRHTASFARRREAVGRGSMDTFIEQVELLTGTPGGTTTSTKVTAKTKTKRYSAVDPEKQQFPGVGAGGGVPEPGPPSPPTGYKQKQRKKRPSLLRRLFCCISGGGGEGYSTHSKKQTEAELRAAAAAVVEGTLARPPRAHAPAHITAHIRPDKRESKVLFETTPPTPPLPMMYPDRRAATSAVSRRPQQHLSTAAVAQGASPASGIVDPNDPGAQFHGYIPAHLSAATQSRLRAELSKPFSDGDEPGYIYVFWLTDTPHSPISTPGGGSHPQTTSAALAKAVSAASSLPTNTSATPRLLLKIGRANNVQRRLHEWSTQCGYNLSLVRFYPHVSASSTPSPAGTPSSTPFLHTLVGKKVPNSHRIERLIHLELRDTADANPEILCKACGKTHKEWFWIDASRDGLHAVDAVLKRWIEYGEKSASVRVPRTPPKSKTASPKTTPAITPVKKRPTLDNVSVGGPVQGKAGKATLSPPSAAGGGGGGRGGRGKSTSPSPSRSSGRSPGRSPGRKKKAEKNSYDDDGDDEYRPDSE